MAEPENTTAPVAAPKPAKPAAPKAPAAPVAGTAPGFNAPPTARVEQVGPLTVIHR